MKPVRCTFSRLVRVTAAVLLLALGFGVLSVAAGADTVFSEDFEGSFTVCPPGWQVYYGNVSRTTRHAASGSASIMVSDTSTQKSASVVSPSIRLERGEYYRITVDVMNLSGNGSVFVYIYDASGKQTDSVSTTVTETGKWTTGRAVGLPDRKRGEHPDSALQRCCKQRRHLLRQCLCDQEQRRR